MINKNVKTLVICHCIVLTALSADIIVGEKIIVGKGARPKLAIDKSSGNIHVIYHGGGGVTHTVRSPQGSEISKPMLIPGSNFDNSGYPYRKGNIAIAVSSDGDPTVFVNKQAGTLSGIAKIGNSWKQPVTLAKANLTWLLSATGDLSGNTYVFFNKSAGWDKAAHVYITMKGVTKIEEKTVRDGERSEGFCDITVDRHDIIHMAWANSTSGFYYASLKNNTLSSPQKISLVSGRSAFTAGVAVDLDDNVHLLNNTKGSNMYYGKLGNGSIIDRHQVSSPAEDGYVAVDDGGTVYVVYYSETTDYKKGDKTVYLEYKQRGGAWSKAIDVGPSTHADDHDQDHFIIKAWKHQAVMAGYNKNDVYIRIITSQALTAKPTLQHSTKLAIPYRVKAGDIFNIRGRRIKSKAVNSAHSIAVTYFNNNQDMLHCTFSQTK